MTGENKGEVKQGARVVKAGRTGRAGGKRSRSDECGVKRDNQMKVLILSKALLATNYQRQLSVLASRPGVEVVAVVPPTWREPGVGVIPLERPAAANYRLIVRPIALNGNFHLYFWRGLGRLLRAERPTVLHIDEESFNLATFQAMAWAARLGIPAMFFNWANIYRRLPPPFAWFERYTLAHAAYAVAGNQEAADILRRKGYRGRLRVIPQFGVDENVFAPLPAPSSALRSQRSGERRRAGRKGEACTIGYAGRFVPQKGVLDLLEAVAGLPGVRLLLVGGGEQEPALRQRAAEGDLAGRVEFAGRVPSEQLPEMYRRMDVFVLPSRTTPRWKEQFGRVLVEAMACAVPVVGSDSGEIPHVIGPAGRTFPEGDVGALRARLAELLGDPALREELGQRGRERVLEHYTQERVAQSYLAVYREIQSPS